jgi:DNA (cytosine-5)-methyltransferase 1
MTSTSYVTVTDQFCGAGGSSLGASLAGAEIKLAINHWKLAVETHNTNFPNTDHDCTDISAVDPRRYPATDIMITAPECTNHSLAKGKIRKWCRRFS